MSQEKRKRIHLIYGCAATVLLLALGVALIVSCLDIYNSGAHPYSPASIGSHFDRIAVLVYVCIAVVLGGIVLNLALPQAEKRPQALRDELAALNKLKAKITLTADSATAAGKELKYRRGIRFITGLIFVALMIYPAIYFANGNNFTITDLSRDIIHAVLIVMIPSVIGLLLCFFCAVLETRSVRREIAIYKTAAADGKSQTPSPVNRKDQKKWLTVIRCAIAIAGICFVVLGILNGGMKDVFDKAVAICTECIGLG